MSVVPKLELVPEFHCCSTDVFVDCNFTHCKKENACTTKHELKERCVKCTVHIICWSVSFFKILVQMETIPNHPQPAVDNPGGYVSHKWDEQRLSQNRSVVLDFQ